MNAAEVQNRIVTLERTLREVNELLLLSRQRLILVRRLIAEPERFERAPGIMVAYVGLALDCEAESVASMLRDEQARQSEAL